MDLSARLWATQPQTGASAPIRPEFEEDIREVDGPGHRARNHFAAVQFGQKSQKTDRTQRLTGLQNNWTCRQS